MVSCCIICIQSIFLQSVVFFYVYSLVVITRQELAIAPNDVTCELLPVTVTGHHMQT